jgi:thiamine kinase-like enzyme
MIDKKDIKQVILKRKKELGIKEVKSVRISRLGMGENNLNFLAVINNKTKFIFRVGLRKRIENNMENEFKALKTIPKGFGPEPVYLDKSKKIIPKKYSVLRYIEGKHIQRWSSRHLKMHAKKLAELHKHKAPYWNRLHKKGKGKFDIYKFFLQEIKEYGKESPQIFKDPALAPLLSKIKDYLKKNNHLFTSQKRFSLSHRDPCITNTIFTKKGVRYIDWEWTGYWDNALDVAMLFDQDYSQPPWKIRLNGKKLDIYLNAYLKHMKDKTLKKRVKVWNEYLKGTDLIFFKWKVALYEKEKSALPKKVYKKYEALVAKSIEKL